MSESFVFGCAIYALVCVSSKQFKHEEMTFEVEARFRALAVTHHPHRDRPRQGERAAGEPSLESDWAAYCNGAAAFDAVEAHADDLADRHPMLVLPNGR